MLLTIYTVCTIYTLMRRVNYHLTEKEIEALAEKSEETGLPVAELIRRAIDHYLETDERRRDETM